MSTENPDHSLLGYARVSTLEQDEALQVDALRAAGCGRVFVDKASGKLEHRPQLDALLDQLRPGGTVAVWRLDRLGRSLRHLIDTVQALDSRGVAFRSLTESIDTSTPAASSSSTYSAPWPSSLLSGHAEMLASPMRGLLPDAVSTGEGGRCGVIKYCGHGIVRRVTLIDDAGRDVVPVTRFLSHLTDANYSPNTVCAYAYDLRHLAVFLDERELGWNDFGPATALEFLAYLRRVPSRRPAQRLGLTVATEQGRLLSAATVQRVLAATSSFFEWAIAAEQYTAGENPMQRRVDHVLGPVPDRHQPFVGSASRQQPVRRTVRVRRGPVGRPR